MKRFKVKKIVLKIGVLAILAMIILPAVQVSAADPYEYTVLAPLPGTTQGTCNNPGDPGCKTTLQEYLPGLFNLLIGLSAVAAVLMIVIGGLQYISTDAIQKKSEGKERIKNAVSSLVLVIGAWLILYTINPNLLHINLNIETSTIDPKFGLGGALPLGGELSAGTGAVKAGYALTQAQVDTNNSMRADLLNNYYVNVNAGPCTDGQTSGCTNLVGMPEVAFVGVTNLKKSCGDNCVVTISGGTEGGHASHGPGLPALDLRSDNTNLNTWITDPAHQTAPVQKTSLGPVYTVKLENGQNATFLQESNPPHWHVVFGGK